MVRFKRNIPRIKRSWESVQKELLLSDRFNYWRWQFSSKVRGLSIAPIISFGATCPKNTKLGSLRSLRIPAVVKIRYKEGEFPCEVWVYPCDSSTFRVSPGSFMVLMEE